MVVVGDGYMIGWRDCDGRVDDVGFRAGYMVFERRWVF